MSPCADQLAAVLDVLEAVGFGPAVDMDDPAKAVATIASTMYEHEAELLILRQHVDKALGIDWRAMPEALQAQKDAVRCFRLKLLARGV